MKPLRNISRVLRATDGSLLVDFVFAIVPLLIMTMAIIETSATMLAQQVLSTKAVDVARIITNSAVMGQAEALERIRSEVCDEGALGLAQASCRSSLLIDVRILSSTPPPPIVVGGEINAAAFGYQSTSGTDTLLLRLALSFPNMTPLWRPEWNRLSNGRNLITSSSMFKTNPYAEYNASGPTP